MIKGGIAVFRVLNLSLSLDEEALWLTILSSAFSRNWRRTSRDEETVCGPAFMI
jgi:hypothetical protein